MWSSRRQRSTRRSSADDRVVQPRLTNVVSRAHGLSVELPRELARSRRHGHPFSLILLEREGEADDAGLHRVVDRLALRLRLSDLLILFDDDRLLIACPETNAAGARVLLRDLVELVSAEGLGARASTATFPKSALTAAELLRACEAGLDGDTGPTHEPTDRWANEPLRVVSERGGQR
jgi:hypothetical protein